MANQPRRRFEPEHIETIFESVRFPRSKSRPIPTPHIDFKDHIPAPATPTDPHQHGPMPEPTPEASPRSVRFPSDDKIHTRIPRPKRDFHPQLIETSRRTRRAGDVGPTTRHSDKTDITPYTDHIYKSRPRSRRRDGAKSTKNPLAAVAALTETTVPSRRESEDEEALKYLLDKAAAEAERKINEAALARAFPNSGARGGDVTHFYFEENSDNENASDSTTSDQQKQQQQLRHHTHHHHHHHHHGGSRLRRKSTHHELRLNWWHQHMQEHAENLSKTRRRLSVPQVNSDFNDEFGSDLDDLDDFELPELPDALWLTDRRKSTHHTPSSPLSPSTITKGPIGETYMPLIAPDPYIVATHKPFDQKRDLPPSFSFSPSFPSSSTPTRPIGEAGMPYIPSGTAGGGNGGGGPTRRGEYKPQRRPVVAEQGFRNNNNDLRPKKKGPPMLGQDLIFRKCPSPKQTKLEPDHLVSQLEEIEQHGRDKTEKTGLWKGYCVRSDSNEAVIIPATLNGPRLLATPHPELNTSDPFAVAFGGSNNKKEQQGLHPASELRINVHAAAAAAATTGGGPLSAPATDGSTIVSSLSSSSSSSSSPTSPSPLPTLPHSPAILTNGAVLPEHRLRSGAAKGLHMLAGLDERLRKEKRTAELQEKIESEFNSTFVTQVYNYLSLGYPAMARSFDEELSKITGIDIEDLRSEDLESMAKGHFVARKWSAESSEAGGGDDAAAAAAAADDSNDEFGASKTAAQHQDKRCPRWRALKLYIAEWARQHPDLDSMDPLAWGVRERRGSWGL